MATNRLYRDKEHAMLGGVCAGIANRFNLDPTLVRVGAIAIAVVTAALPVALVYLALWIIMPAGSEASTKRPSKDELTEEFKTAGSRVTEAGRIVGRAARQAADEISSLQNRPAAPPPVGDEAAGAQAVNEDVLSGEAPPRTPSASDTFDTEPQPPPPAAPGGNEEDRTPPPNPPGSSPWTP